MRKSLFFLIILCISSCSKETKKTIPSPRVNVAKSFSKTVPLYMQNVGHVTPIESVEVMSQVTGVIEKIHFKRGQLVKKGDMLFTIDPRPYIAALEKTKAIYEQTKANLAYAKETAARNQPLVKEDYVSKLTYDGYVNQVEVYKATLAENLADIETAQINLDYCYIRSPMDGKAGDYEVDEGNLVNSGSNTNLVTLNQIVPIHCQFFLPEKDLPTVQVYQAVGGPLKVIAYPDTKKEFKFEGKLVFIDNSVNTTTGMVAFKAEFENDELILWPQQFVDITLILKEIEDAVLVPTQAIQLSTKGKYVYVVEEDETVDQRFIETGQIHEEDTLVSKGLKAGETVVLEGQINLYPGAKVVINNGDDES